MSIEAARAAEVLAALSSPTRLRVFAELAHRGKEGATMAELAYPLDLSKAEVGDACARLVGLGIASGTGDGVYRAKPGELREAAAAVDRLQPIAGVLAGYPQLRGHFAHGRLSSMPPTMSPKYAQLGELLIRFLELDGLYQEDQINRRLATITDDVAAVRRMLVDTGWLERDRAGTTYGVARQPTPL
jgi:DNA-binding transcriptional ArsR family regulator